MKYAQTGAIYQPGSDLHEMRHYLSHPASGLGGESQEEWKHNRKFFEERWWDDGTILAGGREYTALLAARCSRRMILKWCATWPSAP